MSSLVKVAGSWKTVVKPFVKVAGSWKAVTTIWIKRAGVWVKSYISSVPEIVEGPPTVPSENTDSTTVGSDSLTQSGGDGTGSAYTDEAVTEGQNATFSFIPQAGTGGTIDMTVGFADAPGTNDADVDYGFRFTGTNSWGYQQSGYTGVQGTFTPGTDEFKVSVNNGEASYYINDVLQATYPAPIDPPFILLTIFNHEGDGITDMILGPGAPQGVSGPLSFTDVDSDSGELEGTLTIDPASDESNITHYVVYWGSSTSAKQSSTPVGEVAKTGSTINFPIPANTALPSGAGWFLVATKNEYGESTIYSNVAIEDIPVPVSISAAGSQYVEETATGYRHDGTLNQGGGSETAIWYTDPIFPANENVDITFKVVDGEGNWNSESIGFADDTNIGHVDMGMFFSSQDDWQIWHSPSYPVQSPDWVSDVDIFKISLVNDVVYYYMNGELKYSDNINISYPMRFKMYFAHKYAEFKDVVITDGVPYYAPQGISAFTDTDTGTGTIGGSVTITPATSESKITHYALYFGSDATTKMDFIGSVEKTGGNVAISIPSGTSIPVGATYLIAVSRNSAGDSVGSVSTIFTDVVSATPGVFRIFATDYASGRGDDGIFNTDEVRVYDYGRDWHITVWDQEAQDWATGINFYGASASDGTHGRFDTWNSSTRSAQQAAFVTTLQNVDPKYVVIITATHAPENFSAAMRTEVLNCGGSTANTGWSGNRASYICVGRRGVGDGNGFYEALDNLSSQHSEITANLNDIPISLGSSYWSATGDSPTLTEVAEGLELSFTQARPNWHYLTSDMVFDIRGKSVFIKRKMNSGGNYSSVNSTLLDSVTSGGILSDNPLSLDFSWNGSYVLTEDVYYYTRYTINSDMTYTWAIASGNYDTEGGTVVNSGSGTLTATTFEYASHAKIRLTIGDAHAGEGTITLNEVKIK